MVRWKATSYVPVLNVRALQVFDQCVHILHRHQEQRAPVTWQFSTCTLAPGAYPDRCTVRNDGLVPKYTMLAGYSLAEGFDGVERGDVVHTLHIEDKISAKDTYDLILLRWLVHSELSLHDDIDAIWLLALAEQHLTLVQLPQLKKLLVLEEKLVHVRNRVLRVCCSGYSQQSL